MRSFRGFGTDALTRMRGLSLVELMIASLLGVLLLAALASLYLAGKRQYFHDEQLARLQENGRYATGLLRRELQMAGFYGGVLPVAGIEAVAIPRDCSDEPWALSTASPLTFVDDHLSATEVRTTGDRQLDCIDGRDVAPGTDVLAVRRTAAEASVADGLVAPDLSSYSTWRWFLQVSPDRPPQWRRLASRDLPGIAVEGPGTSLWKAVARIFYIRRYSAPDNRNDGLPVLCMEELVNEAMLTRCLVEGVENLQLELGVDTDGDGIANRYLNPRDTGDLADAVAARVHLLLRSVFQVPGPRASTSYRLGSVQVNAAGDGYLRRVFSTTIQLRNVARRPIPVLAGQADEPV
jgi:type IV pilus assembly protein PilW